MKSFTLSLLLVLAFFPLRADSELLVNSKFTDGHAHWQGDGKDIDSGDIGSETSTPGTVIHLKKDKWTKIFQLVTVRDKKLFYTVTFQLSDDFKISQRERNDYATADLGDVPGLMFQGELSESGFSVLLQGGDNFDEETLRPDRSKVGQSQTLTGRLNPFNTGVQSVFLIAFPPGEGTVTLTQASLSTVDPNSQQ